MTACPSMRLARPLLSALAAALAAVALAACSDRSGPGARQTAARVNKEEITVQQIDFVLQQQRGLKPEQVDAASRLILERLIDQQLALQKADDQKLDRDPKVLQQIEIARREIIARAFVEKIGEAAAKPTAEEIKTYYDSKPALFKERRVYNIQEIGIEAKPDQVPALREKLAAVKNIAEFIDHLKSNDFRFAANQAVRAAEQLPLQNLDSFARMQDGQAAIVPAANGIQVVVLASSRSQPVTEEQARPAIELFLLNDRRRKRVADEIKAMRSAAKIEYVGKFEAGAAEAAANAASAGGAAAAEALGGAASGVLGGLK